ncbi:MAG: prepilin-type N-terminal cleavage/methylation domain-containing protein [Chloroflexi bacterium]|nr:prepilin-type N-terminal cleavage/methylation domain-containing protein [Chloroflexota bacterium]
MLKMLRHSRGFTLIELIIVLAVLGILAAIVVPNVAGYIEQGKQRSLTADQRILQASVDAWRTDVANRVGNAWPTVGGVKGTPASGTGGTFSGTGGTNSIIKVSDLTSGNFLKGTDVVKSFKFNATTGTTGATNSPVGSYYWYVDSSGVVTAWYDANDDKVVDTGETGYEEGVYP